MLSCGTHFPAGVAILFSPWRDVIIISTTEILTGYIQYLSVSLTSKPASDVREIETVLNN